MIYDCYNRSSVWDATTTWSLRLNFSLRKWCIVKIRESNDIDQHFFIISKQKNHEADLFEFIMTWSTFLSSTSWSTNIHRIIERSMISSVNTLDPILIEILFNMKNDTSVESKSNILWIFVRNILFSFWISCFEKWRIWKIFFLNGISNKKYQ